MTKPKPSTPSPAAPEEIPGSDATSYVTDGVYHQMVRSLQAYGIVFLDLKGFVRSWNPGAQRITGYEESEILGKHLSVFHSDADRAAGKPGKELEIATRFGMYEEEGWRLRKDGTRYWANVVTTAIRTADNRTVGFTKVFRDQTDRRMADEQLRLSEQRFRTMVESVRDYAIFMLDARGYVTTWNAGAERLKGYRTDEIMGSHFSRFYPKEDIENGKPAWELDTAARLGRLEDEGWRIRKDGSRFWAFVVITALRSPDGKLMGFAKVTRDITERKKAEEELRKSKDELEIKVKERTAALLESNRDLEQFAYIASHDLQEPIRKVFLYGDRLQKAENCLGPREKEWLDRMLTAASRLKGIVQDLLQFSRISHIRPTFETVSLEETVLEAASDFEVKMQEAGGTVDVGHLPNIRANRSQMLHVFQNLISNSLKFAREGVPPVITVRSEPAPVGQVRLTVSDNGIGFDEVYAERIFKPFQRLHSRAAYEGSGIGLSIVQRIVQVHGGKVTARSQPGNGSTFIIELPSN